MDQQRMLNWSASYPVQMGPVSVTDMFSIPEVPGAGATSTASGARQSQRDGVAPAPGIHFPVTPDIFL